MDAHVKSLQDVKPTTLEGIKRLAKQLKRERGIQHASALELAAAQAGFASFFAARKALAAGGAA